MTFYAEIKRDVKEIFNHFIEAAANPEKAWQKFNQMDKDAQAKVIAITAVVAVVFGIIGAAFVASSIASGIVLGFTFAVVTGTFAFGLQVGKQMKTNIF